MAFRDTIYLMVEELWTSTLKMWSKNNVNLTFWSLHLICTSKKIITIKNKCTSQKPKEDKRMNSILNRVWFVLWQEPHREVLQPGFIITAAHNIWFPFQKMEKETDKDIIEFWAVDCLCANLLYLWVEMSKSTTIWNTGKSSHLYAWPLVIFVCGCDS